MRADIFEGIVVFTRVAARRSFTAAALELGVTPAAISWTIKQLEARVGAPLFTRTTRSVGLTEAGQVFLEQASAGVAYVEAAYEAAQRLSDNPRGLLGRHSCINIRLAGGAVYRWDFVEHTEEIGTRSFVMDVAGGLTVNGPATSLSAAQAGVGLAYNIAGVVEPLIRQGLLETCLETFMPTSPGFFIYFPDRKQALPKLRAFVDYWHNYHPSQANSLNAQIVKQKAKSESGAT